MRSMMTARRKLVAGLIGSMCTLAACSGSHPASTAMTEAPATTTSSSGFVSLGTADYSDAAGDEASITLYSQPLVQPGQVPDDVAQACLADDDKDNGDLVLSQSLFREITGAMTLTSKRSVAANIRFGGSSSATSSGEETVVQVNSNGPECSGSSPLLLNVVSPGQTLHFTIWLIYPNVLTSSQPNGNEAAIDAAAWRNPSVFLADDLATIKSVSGAGLTHGLFFPAGRVVTSTEH